MTDELPPPPPAEPAPPPPREKWRWPVYALLALTLAGAVCGNLAVVVRFTDDAGRVPGPFKATLKSGGSEKKILVEKGRLNLLRGRWQMIEITDDAYVLATEEIRGGKKMRVTIERNALLKLKQASNGQPSVPQRGDPDPADD